MIARTPVPGATVLRRAASALLLAAGALVGTAALAQSSYPNPYTWSTVAGAVILPTGADGTGGAAQFFGPGRICVDGSGNVYVADYGDETIRKVTPAGVVTTIAGTAGQKGSANGTGAAASFNGPNGVAVDSSGNLYVADSGNNQVRKIAPGGIVTTFAGSATAGSADGTGTAAQFNGPVDLTVANGNLYVLDQVNQTIRQVTLAGVVTTFAGTAGVPGSTNGTGITARFNYPAGLGTDGNGNLYVADTNNDQIRMVTSGAVVTTLAGELKSNGTADGTGAAAQFDGPSGIAADSSGNVYVADSNANTIRKVTSAGVVTTIAGVPLVFGFDDGVALSAEFDFPIGLAVDASGDLYISDDGNNTIRKLAGGNVTTIAGTPGPGYADGTGAAARFYEPANVAVDGSGTLYVTDELNSTIRKVTPAGVVTTLAGSPGAAAANDGTGSAARFNEPFGITVDSGGNVYVADAANSTIRKITPGGAVSTYAGTAGSAGSADGTGAAARFKVPLGLAIDGSGNIYVAEQGNFTIRKIAPGGVVTTLAGTAGSVGSSDGTGSAAQFNLPAGVAVDSSGNVYVADYANDEIRKITPGGVVTTLAGQPQNAGSKDGTGAAAQFYLPTGITIDASGNLYVTEQKNDTIRMITPAGVVTTIGGTPTISGANNGTGSSASFTAPEGITVDSSGTLYVADSGNNLIRKGILTGAPQISSAPSGVFVKVGAAATFSVTATGGSALSYQWFFNGAAISGATSSTYAIASVQAGNAGNYSVTVTDSGGSLTSPVATLTINTGTATTRLINIATRAMVGINANILIPGFVIGGNGVETLLIRADGPSLTQFGVTGVLAQPTLKVLNGAGAVLATNTGWSTATNAALLASTAAQVHAFAFSAGSADCAVIVTLPAGAYTVEVSGVNNTSGVALAEVYEVTSTGTRLINIATRAAVGTGANLLIPGFVISGSGTEQLLVRGDGPSLTAFGVTGALKAPSLSVFDGAGNVIVTNTGWGTATDPTAIANAASAAGAFPFTAGSLDSAAIVNLAPGAYTMEVSGAAATIGIGLAEVYEIP